MSHSSSFLFSFSSFSSLLFSSSQFRTCVHFMAMMGVTPEEALSSGKGAQEAVKATDLSGRWVDASEQFAVVSSSFLSSVTVIDNLSLPLFFVFSLFLLCVIATDSSRTLYVSSAAVQNPSAHGSLWRSCFFPANPPCSWRRRRRPRPRGQHCPSLSL